MTTTWLWGLRDFLLNLKKPLCFRKLWHLGSEHLHPSSSNAPLLLLHLAVPRHIRNNLDPSMLLPLNGERQMISLALVFPWPLKATIFFLILPGSAKLALDLSFQLRLPVNKQHICCQSGADTERLMLLKLSRTSWDSALSQFYPNNDFQIKPTIRPLIRARESS